MASLAFALLCCVFVGILTVPSYAQTCVNVGSACNGSCSAPGGPTACSDSHCDTTSFTCVDVASLGQSCDTTGTGVGPDCLGDQVYYNWASTCLSSSGVCGTNTDPLSAGDACDATEKAVGNATNGGCAAGSSCTGGKCTSAGGSGAACTFGSGAPCDNGFYCTFTAGCAAMSTLGQPCKAFLQPCVNGLVCASNGTCITPLTAASGAACSPGNIFGAPAVGAVGSTECQVGLACDSTSMTCVTVDSSKVGQPCNVAADCGSQYLCLKGGSCSAPGNFCVLAVSSWASSIASAWLTYEQCLGTNTCSTAALNLAFSNLPFKGTAISNCAQVNCFTEWQAFVNTWARTGAYTECASSTTTAGPATTGTTMTMSTGTFTTTSGGQVTQATNGQVTTAATNGQTTAATNGATSTTTATSKHSAGSVLNLSAVLAMIFALCLLA